MSELMGFTFKGIHSSQYNIQTIYSGNRYTEPLFAEFEDVTEQITGYDGVYYFGTSYRQKDMSIECLVNGVDEVQLRSIQWWLNPKEPGILTLDSTPYKYYIAKVSNRPNLEYVGEADGKGGFLYKGTFSLTFTAYDPFAYSYINSVDDYSYFEESQGLWYYDSGILYAEETPPTTLTNVIDYKHFYLYNGGNHRTKPIITFTGSADVITLTNNTTNQSFTLEGLDNVKMTVDCQKGYTRVEDTLANSHHDGTFIELEGNMRVDRHAAHLTQGSTSAIVTKPNLDIVKRFIAVSETWYKVLACDFETGEVTLDKEFTGGTDDYNITVMDLNEISISGMNINLSEIEFDYKFCYL